MSAIWVTVHCGTEAATFIRPLNGVSRATRTGAQSQRRVWRCGGCRKQFSVLTGTVFHGTKIALRKWVLVIFEMVASKNGVAAREIERKYGICPRSAWFMLHRIREAMSNDNLIETMRGTIVADETFIGGAAKNMHASTRHTARPFTPGTPVKEKIPVFSLINAETGEVRSAVVPNVDGRTLGKVMAEQIDMAGSVLHTDFVRQYITIGKQFRRHERVNHEDGQYVNERGAGTNLAENFFSQLKRSIDGTHHHVSDVHLHRYLDEFDFRYSTRRLDDGARMRLLVGQTGGRRLSYKRVRSVASSR